MNAPFATDLLGWKLTKGKPVPNTADVDSAASVALGSAMLDNLGVPRDALALTGDLGTALEHRTRDDLRHALPELAPLRRWGVERGVSIAKFAQYQHLDALDRLVKSQPELRVTVGMDYLIKPDVNVWVESDDPHEPPYLHGVVSCKWTIRSDRVQNIRHEFGQMIHHRRGRLPHLVTLTAEPLPTRLAAIARGTGEVDATYHIAFDALATAVEEVANKDQRDAWNECVEQGRLKSYAELAPTFATY